MPDESRCPLAGPSASLLVLAMGLGWGVNWIAPRVILEWLPPWTMRALGIGLGALTIFVAAYVRRTALDIPRPQRLHIVVSAVFNVLILNVCSAYSQIFGTTSRAIVIVYSMPIWSALLARIFLKERLGKLTLLALGLCAAGLVVLIWPVARVGIPFGVLFAFGGAWSWAVGTVYLKWADIRADSLAITAWQLLLGFLALAFGMLWFEGSPHAVSLPTNVILWILYNGTLGLGLAYFLWFLVIESLPAVTASLGTLLVPVIGMIGSALVIGERPGPDEIFGFALILAAAGSVLFQHDKKSADAVPPE